MRTLYITLFLLSITFSGVSANNYSVDKSHTVVAFEVTHMVISKVSGKFADFSSTLTFDENNLDNFVIETIVKIESVSTENEKRDNHLKSNDFFNAEKFPEMVFKSSKVEKTENGYVAHGSLTIRDITKNIEMPFKVTGKITDPWGNDRIGIEASTEINRQEFDVKWSKSMDAGGLVVSDEVTIKINAEFIKNKDNN